MADAGKGEHGRAASGPPAAGAPAVVGLPTHGGEEVLSWAGLGPVRLDLFYFFNILFFKFNNIFIY